MHKSRVTAALLAIILSTQMVAAGPLIPGELPALDSALSKVKKKPGEPFDAYALVEKPLRPRLA